MKFFQMFDMSISSGDICDQSRKLSKIAPKFARFFGPPKFLGVGLPKVIHALSPYLGLRHLGKFRKDTSISPEVIEAHTLNFKPNFKFSRLNFFGETPVPACVCAR